MPFMISKNHTSFFGAPPNKLKIHLKKTKDNKINCFITANSLTKIH